MYYLIVISSFIFVILSHNYIYKRIYLTIPYSFFTLQFYVCIVLEYERRRKLYLIADSANYLDVRTTILLYLYRTTYLRDTTQGHLAMEISLAAP